MLAIELTSHLLPQYETNKFFYHHHRRRNCQHFRHSVIKSSSIIKETEKQAVASDDGRKELLPGWEAIALPPVTAAKRVVLVRHGQSTWNAEGRIQGSSDYSVLTVKGESQAETSRQMLLNDSFDVCFSSPLTRSKRTAEIIWGSRKEEILTDSNLREIDLYSFQGLLKNEGKAKYGETFRQWQIDAPNFCIDGHYPVRELWSRARSCWTKILTHESESILVVAHNAVNQALVATAIGLGTEYFRILLQSNCGVSVLDFTPNPEGGSPDICLNRLNQTPSSPLAAESDGRKANTRIILVCHGFPQNELQGSVNFSGESPMTMLGTVQAQKTAEVLLDVKVNTIVSSHAAASVETANAIFRMQEAADCLGADCVPRYVQLKQIQDLDVGNILNQTNQTYRSGWLKGINDEIKTSLWDKSGKAWKCLVDELSQGTEPGKNVVAIGHPALHIAIFGHCLNLTKERLRSFHLAAGSISVIDFPDGPKGRSVIRCINYTAHLVNYKGDIKGDLTKVKAKIWEELYQLYRDHSNALGFGTKMSTGHKSVSGKLLDRYFQCQCQGYARRKNAAIATPSPVQVGQAIFPSPVEQGQPLNRKKKQKRCSVTRTGCKAEMRVKWIKKEDLYEVVRHTVEHNHELTSTYWNHYKRSERHISEATEKLIEQFDEAGIRPKHGYNVLGRAAGGEEYVGHIRRDYTNFVQRFIMKKIERGDAQNIVDRLSQLMKEDPRFYYIINLGDDSRLSDIFWRDPMMMNDYDLYGDIVIFDTTYTTNRYNLICAPIVGINNHWNTVMLGCAFLSNETEKSFVWLLEEFIKSMGGKEPKTIFTDQDQAMSNAIKQVFKDRVRHRLFLWHIQQNAISHFGKLKNDEMFKEAFNHCLKGCTNEAEFETCWSAMTQKYDLKEDGWFNRLYGLK